MGAARRVQRPVEDVGGLQEAEAGPRAVEREDDRRRRDGELPVEVVLALDPEDGLRGDSMRRWRGDRRDDI